MSHPNKNLHLTFAFQTEDTHKVLQSNPEIPRIQFLCWSTAATRTEATGTSAIGTSCRRYQRTSINSYENSFLLEVWIIQRVPLRLQSLHIPFAFAETTFFTGALSRYSISEGWSREVLNNTPLRDIIFNDFRHTVSASTD